MVIYALLAEDLALWRWLSDWNQVWPDKLNLVQQKVFTKKEETDTYF